MPTFSTTARHALRWLTGSNLVSDIDAGFQALAEDIDAKMASYAQGLLAARPTSTPGSPGVSGRHYYATDLGIEFVDTGTGWAPAGLPIGGGLDWFGTADPSPELMICDGRAISRSTYATLFAALGTTFGPGNGSTTFNLPDARDRTLVGVSGTIARGAAGGAKTHTLTTAEMPAHFHPYSTYGDGTSGAGYDGRTMEAGNAALPIGGLDPAYHSSATVGGGGAHNNMQPYLGAHKVIRVL